MLLRRLRTGERDARALPSGGLFRLVSCPHYLFEIVVWIGFFAAAPNDATRTFLWVGAAIMLVRALFRHRAYRRRFDGREGRPLYPRSRRALIPYVV